MIVHGPRPKGRIRPEQLPAYEKTGNWIIQRKYNGHKNTIYISGDQVDFYNKGAKFLRYKMPEKLRKQFAALNLKGKCWLDGELLHPTVKDTVVLYDALQLDGKYLIGKTQIERLNLLSEVCVNPQQLCSSGVALQVSDNIWLAEWWDKDFACHFEEFLDLDLIEGLVLRRKKGRLMNMGHLPYETDDQIRCRKNSKKYRF